MDSAKPSATGFATQLFSTAAENLPTPVTDFVSHSPILATVAVVLLGILFFSFPLGKRGKQAPAIPEAIPFVSNSVAYMRDLPSFCRSVGKHLSEQNVGIATFRLFMQKMHLVVGAENTTPLFQQRTSGLSDHRFMVMFMDAMCDPPKADLDQWRFDTSGRLKVPNPGSEHVTGHSRVMVKWHSLMNNYLARPSMALELAEMYYGRFLERFESEEVFGPPGGGGGGKWVEMRVFDWIKANMTPAAGVSFGGTLLYEMFPDYFDVMRQFERSILKICFGSPRWVDSGPYKVRDRWLEMNEKVMKAALERIDWAEADGLPWIPEMGHSVLREITKWLVRDRKVSLRTTAGYFGAMVLDQNGNTVPAAAWAIMQILTSPASGSLVERLRDEAERARKPADGRFDVQKLAGMPVYSAVFTETLRLHCNFNITRMAVRDIVMEGYDVRKGSLVQAPTLIAHFDPVWEDPAYPVAEFWPDRLLRTAGDGSGKAEFDMSSRNRSSYWFPFGGGLSMCPGRIFAKQEVCLALAMFFTTFDAEVVRWETLDGTAESDRPAKDVEGFITMLPDRDLRIRVRRRR